MAFDFFNNSNLAFGSKLTKVFTILDRLAEDAEGNVDQIAAIQSEFEQFLHKNYIIPKPTSPQSPCRTDELFLVCSGKKIYIRSLKYDNIVKEVEFSAVLFNKSTNRFTVLEGNSDVKEGFIRYKESISNTNPKGDVVFTKKEDDKDFTTICEYRVDDDGKLNLVGDVSKLALIPYDISQYTNISKGKTLATNSAKYTSDDYQAVCIVGVPNKIIVNLNGKKVLGNTQELRFNKRHTILYLKPKDVITGTYSTIFRINYGS